MNKPLQILFKYPTRSRPERFFKGLNSIVNNLDDQENYHVMVTADEDDETMNNDQVKERLAAYKNVSIIYGKSDSKIHAVNRDMDKAPAYDVLGVHSDDMRWLFYGFDQVIRQEMEGDLDRLLHIGDSDAKHLLPTYYIAGRPFYERFGFIYDPSFASLWCDNLVFDVAVQMKKYKYVDYATGMLFHEHPSYGHISFDTQYNEQQGKWQDDETVYRRIVAEGLDKYISKFTKQ